MSLVSAEETNEHPPPAKQEASTSAPNGSNIQIADVYPSTRNTAVALIAIGNVINTQIVEWCMISLRDRGKYDGLVMIVTDHAPKLQGQMANDMKVIVLAAKASALSPTKPNGVVIWYHTPNIIYKWFKTLLLDYFEAEPRLAASTILHILYMDVNVVTVKPLDNFFRDYHHQSLQKNFEASTQEERMNLTNVTSFMSMFLDNPEFGHQHNTGTIMLDC